MRDHVRAERPAKRGKHGARVPEGRFGVGALALGHPVQELIEVELLRLGLGVDPRMQLGRQLLQDVAVLVAREPLGQRLQRRLRGAFGHLCAQAAGGLPDYLDELLVFHSRPPAVR